MNRDTYWSVYDCAWVRCDAPIAALNAPAEPLGAPALDVDPVAAAPVPAQAPVPEQRLDYHRAPLRR